MKTASLIRLASKLNLEVFSSGQRFSIEGPLYNVRWINQEGSAICINIARHSDNDDSQTDYFAGFYTQTLKQAQKYLEMKNENNS